MATFTGDNYANTINGSSFDDVINARGGNDVVDAGDGNDFIDGGSGHDILRGGRGNDQILGGNGNDNLNGGEGDDILNGGAGSDWANFEGGAAVYADLTTGLATGQGNDTMIGIERLNGSSFNDTLKGNSGANTLQGGAGDDLLIATGGSDILDGGADIDTVTFAEWSSSVSVNLGGGGMQGAGSGTVLNIENVIGTAFNDVIGGSNVDNLIDGGLGNDWIDAYAGVDTITYASMAANTYVNVDLTANTARQYTNMGASLGVDTLYNVENVIGTSGIDTIRGNASNNVINGGAASDLLQASLGVDHLDGGTGVNDTVEFSNVGPVTASLATNTYTINASNYGTMANIDHLTGGASNDVLSGDAANNYIQGGNGSDVLSGGLGNDELWGGLGGDRLIADGGDDYLSGNGERLGASNQQAYEQDIFEIRTNAGNVTIADFEVGVDKLDLTAFGFDQNGVSPYWTGSVTADNTCTTLTLTGQQGEVVNITLNGVPTGGGFSTADMIGGSSSLIHVPQYPTNGGNGVADLFVIDPNAQTISVGGSVVAAGANIMLTGFENGLDQFDLRTLYAQGWDGNLGLAPDGSVILLLNDAYGNQMDITVQGWTIPQVDETDYIFP